MDKQTWESMTQQDREEWVRFQAWQQRRHLAETASQIPAQQARAASAPSTFQQPRKRPRRWPWFLGAAVFALLAIGAVAIASAHSPSSAQPTAAAPPPASTPEEAFVADVLDTPGLNSTMTDEAMIGIGWGACEVMAYQEYNRADLVTELGTSKLGPEVAAVVVDAAHGNLCPQYTFPLTSSADPVNTGSTDAAPAPTGPATSVSDGTYEVGTDVEEGRYKTTGPEPGARSCYHARLSDDTGDSSSIIANDLSDGPTSVTVKAGEFIKFNGGCEWTKQS